MEKFYSTLEKKEQYLEEIKDNTQSNIFWASLLVFPFIIIYSLIFYFDQLVYLLLVILIILLSLFIIWVIWCMKDYKHAKKTIEKGTVGLRIDQYGIYFGLHFRNEFYKYSEIEFVFVGKDRQGITLMIKKNNSPKIEMTKELLSDNDKFINKLKDSDKKLYWYPADKLIDKDKLINSLKANNMLIYYGDMDRRNIVRL